MRRALILVFILAGCGQPVRDEPPANTLQAAEPTGTAPEVAAPLPVRIGELGANFDACSSVGITRRLENEAALTMRAAPFDYAAEIGTVPAGARFFVCSRSLDQKWLGIVLHESGTLSAACGVSEPVSRKRAYDGPCRSGWVASAGVRSIAGTESPVTPNRSTKAENSIKTAL
ncbi:hypothetical protein [Sphingosinicella sp. BN140058]|uniref:hypothetical protein n=1 Tax=Sphingosinicella sp. BN140058 TaxID=1892855 RepID=UPI0010107845|nr:hypothetical protein [Sphingosinicella sp. BN140058]QAY78337.1 hypothetical protein ETR14_18705 [Sphingosinicella sp. BN140058]